MYYKVSPGKECFAKLLLFVFGTEKFHRLSMFKMLVLEQNYLLWELCDFFLNVSVVSVNKCIERLLILSAF